MRENVDKKTTNTDTFYAVVKKALNTHKNLKINIHKVKTHKFSQSHGMLKK